MTFGSTDEAELARAKRVLASLTPSQRDQLIPTVTSAEVTSIVKDALTPSTADLDDLLAKARENLHLGEIKGDLDDGEFEAPDPHLINELVAKADELKRESDRATKERGKITNFLKEVTLAQRDSLPEDQRPKVLALTVNRAPVFAVNHIVSRVLDQDFIKAKHPDTPKNANYWKDSITDRGDYK